LSAGGAEELSLAVTAAPSEDDPLIGATVGSWMVTSLIGEGGMGRVYAAMDPESGARVAVKVLEISKEATKGRTEEDKQLLLEEAKQRFAREINVAIEVGREHPHIIQILKSGRLDDGRPYFVMEYLYGRSLAKRIAEAPPRGAELRRLLEQVCNALLVIHKAGVLHRDLKPENIWILEPEGAESQAKILDFGVSKVEGASPLTKLGGLVGSPCYMAPEQARSRGVDERSDVYSLGAVLREMVTGVCLFGEAGRSITAVLSDVLSTAPPPLVPRPGFVVSPELERLISDCLEKDPDKRPQNMTEVKARLMAALDACANCEGPAVACAPELAFSKTEAPVPRLSAAGPRISAGVGPSSQPSPRQSGEKGPEVQSGEKGPEVQSGEKGPEVQSGEKGPDLPRPAQRGEGRGEGSISLAARNGERVGVRGSIPAALPPTAVLLRSSRSRSQTVWLVAIVVAALGLAAAVILKVRQDSAPKAAVSPSAPAAPAPALTPPPPVATAAPSLAKAETVAAKRGASPISGPRARTSSRSPLASRAVDTPLQPGPAPASVAGAPLPDKSPPLPPAPTPAAAPPVRAEVPGVEARKPSRQLSPSERDLITDKDLLLR
jgi:serine/threonine protein kinase